MSKDKSRHEVHASVLDLLNEDTAKKILITAAQQDLRNRLTSLNGRYTNEVYLASQLSSESTMSEETIAKKREILARNLKRLDRIEQLQDKLASTKSGQHVATSVADDSDLM